MKEEINLLPPPLQRTRRHRLYVMRLGHVLHRLVLATFFVTLVLSSMYLVLWYIKAQKYSLISSTQSDAAVEQQTQEVNTLLNAVHQRLTTYQYTSPLIEQLLQVMPSAVRLTAVSLEEKNGQIVLQGISSDRAAITGYEKSLRELPWVDKVEAPLRNFATGQRTPFTLTLTRKQPSL